MLRQHLPVVGTSHKTLHTTCMPFEHPLREDPERTSSPQSQTGPALSGLRLLASAQVPAFCHQPAQ